MTWYGQTAITAKGVLPAAAVWGIPSCWTRLASEADSREPDVQDVEQQYPRPFLASIFVEYCKYMEGIIFRICATMI